MTMPRGKELEQLPMANTLPSAGEDKSKFNRSTLNGYTKAANPAPAQVAKKK